MATTSWQIWLVPVLELAAAAACILGAGYFNGCERASRLLAIGITAWAAGDVIRSAHTAGLFSVSAIVPSSLHLLFFPLAVAGLTAFVWGDLREVDRPSALEGAIATLAAGAASVIVVFPVRAELSISSPFSGIQTANTILVILFTAGVAGIFGATYRCWKWHSTILCAGLALMSAASCSQAFQSQAGQSGFGRTLGATLWPLGILAVSWTCFLPMDRPLGSRTEPRAAHVVPHVAAAAALFIEFVTVAWPVTRIGQFLAALTLLAAGVRLYLLLHETQAISSFRHAQAATDELTGVWNRRHLFRVLDSYYAKLALGEPEPELALLFVDLNRFKEINDSFGHPAGDHLLKLVASRLQGSLRDSDILGRLGGDEFAVILPGSDLEAATRVAIRLSTALEHPFQIGTVSSTIGASVGIAMAPNDADNSESLVQCADIAMYRAKTENSRLANYEQTVDVERDQMRLLEELRTAIQEDELILHYQPQLDLTKGCLIGVEALIRWNHPRLGLLYPPAFLPLAEETGEIAAVTCWVMDHAASQLATWRQRGFDISMSVNISPSILLDHDVIDLVRQALTEYDLPPSSLVLEITENWIIAELDAAREVMRNLGELGVIVSIDDFGAGATSLPYLANLPAGELKLDRTFIVGLSTGENDRKPLVRSTVELGHSLGLRIVAEGIEDPETLQMLRALGCDLAQGYYISKPKPPNELPFNSRSGWEQAA